MKKTYISPAMETELFETSDIITASVLLLFISSAGESDGVTTVNVRDELNAAE